MKKLIKIAVIGGSYDSTIGSTHLKSLLATGKFKITCGFFSRAKSKNKLNVKMYNISNEKIYNNLNKLIIKEKNNFDLVIVLSPPNTRYSIYKELVKNNIKFITEKPFEGELNNAIKSYKLLKSKKNFLCSTYNYLGYPSLLEIKPLIKKQLGKIINFNIEMPQQAFILNFKKIKKWRLKDNKIPNIHLDLASHLLSLLIYFFDEYPNKVMSYETKLINKKVIDNSYVWLKFKNFMGNLWFSKNSAGERNEMSIRIYGTKASIEWKHSKSDKIILKKNNGQIEIIDRLSKNKKFINNNNLYTYSAGHPNGFLDAFINIYNEIFRIYHNENKNPKSPFILNLKQNLNIISILNSMHQSAKKNIWQKIKVIS